MTRQPGEPRRWCEWDHEPIPDNYRADTVTCSTRCRQARARARRAGFTGDLVAWRRLPRIGRQRFVQVPLLDGRRVTATGPAGDEATS